MKKLTKLALTIILALLCYLNQNYLLFISLLMLIFSAAIDNNYFAYITIIPLFKINPTYFFILGFFSLLLIFSKKLLKSEKAFLLASIPLALIIYVISYLYLEIKWELIIILIIWQALLLISKLFITRYKSVLSELQLMTILIISFPYLNLTSLLVVYTLLTVVINFLYLKNFFIFTSYFIMIFYLYNTQNYLYGIILIIAYLISFINKKLNDSNDINPSIILSDLKQNINSFCNLIQDFQDTSFNTHWEKRLSCSIKILIENNCKSCKNRTACYSSLKFKTYKYLKDLLLNNNEIGYFSCLYYSDMVLSSKDIAKKYELNKLPKKDNYYFNNLTTSLTNYFNTLFDKLTPKAIKILSFPQLLPKNKITDYEAHFIDETHFTFQIKTHNHKEIRTLIEQAFPLMNIQEDNDKFFIYPKTRFYINHDAATLSHNNFQLSGDNYWINNCPEGLFVCALSDGMGSGYEAYKLSSETLKMLQKIINCGLDYETSLILLNNFFKIKDLEEAYSTLDFVNINLLNGKMHLYKLGSSTTYIVREEKIIPIYNNNLPFGISDLVTKEEYNLQAKDLIILVSDGITDYIKESKLQKIILKLKNETPHKIVYDILQSICRENNNQISDDMTCIALKISENS